jgi:hypothetical protein
MFRALLLFVLCLPSVNAQDVLKTWQSGDVTLTLRVTPKSPVVADEVRLELKLIAPKDVHVEMPDAPGVIDCANVLDRESPSPEVKGGRMIHREVFLLDPIAAGTCHIPPIGVRYSGAAIASEEVSFPITSMISPDDKSPDIRDGQTPLPLAEPRFNWMVVALGTLVVLAVIAWFTFSGKPAVPAAMALEPPEIRALHRLAELEGQTHTVPREFYSELSRILTAYLEERLGTRASRFTSHEILEAVRFNGCLTPVGRDLLEALLEDCDCAKFSPECALGDDPRAAVTCCRKIIEIVGARAASAARWSGGKNAA